MSLRGVRQLKELVIRYSDYDGSSLGARTWMQQNLLTFAKSNPELKITAEVKRSKHPCVTGRYLNGNVKTIGIKNLNPLEVQEQVLHLRNQLGRRMNSNGYKKPVVTMNPSIQGEWHERMDILELPLEIVHQTK